jgi:hypothetical protein
MWYEWNNKVDFDLWHDVICDQLGLPIVGTNQATGELDADAQQTVTYTKAFNVSGKWIAMVEDEYADGLTATDLRLTIES